MRARMTVDAKIVSADPDHPKAIYFAGQELEGAEAETQVSLGHAEALPEASEVPAEESAEAPVATPAAQAHAEELGIDLSAVPGTGADGKITKADVAAAVKEDGA